MARRRLRVAFICMSVEIPNAKLSAFGDQRWAMRVFFDRATGGTASASLCSDAMSEERVLSNAFGAGRFSLKRAQPKGGSSSLKTVIIAEGANIRQLQYTKQPVPKISGTGALLVA